MSASYEERRDVVADALWDEHLHMDESYSVAVRLAEVAVVALDHIPERVDWVAKGYTRDTE